MHVFRGASVRFGGYTKRVRNLVLSVALAGLMPASAWAQADEPPPPPPPPGEAANDAGAPPPEDQVGFDYAPLEPGEAVVTRFSQWTEQDSQAVIDINGASASIIDLRRPPDPPNGQHWIDEPQRLPVTAGEVGQVFGVTLAPRKDDAPDIYLSATAAFGLHREGPDWMAGMWGPDAGPGTIYKVTAETGYLAEKFADVKLNGRDNTGASLGNIAFDGWNNRIVVSDMETGMIHSLDAATGQDLAQYDHGVDGRTAFIDAWSGSPQRLDAVAFDPSTRSRIEGCPGGFDTSPECWNIADFRRRVWGLNVRRGSDGEIRLYYSVWGSDSYGNPAWADAGDDRRNSVWSVRIGDGGAFETGSVRREFFLPAFWPSTPDMGSKAGNSNPASDITFPKCGPQDVMIVSERGGLRNLGLGKPEAFARPYESRVLRYELGSDNIWRPKGRYEVGFHDRGTGEGEPRLFANASGGADFGYGLGQTGSADISASGKSLWMTGDGLCSPRGACTSMETGAHDDTSEVHGLQGSPSDGFAAVDAQSSSTVQASAGAADFGTLDESYMIDTDINTGDGGQPIAAELSRDDATKIGDVAIYEACEAAPPLPVIDIPDEAIRDEAGPPPLAPPEDWPVHTLRASHDKQASTGHSTRRSWHRRNASWHDVDRSWHWRNSSWHRRSQTWHWREGSWHTKAQSWHRKGESLHTKRFSWHFRAKSWHMKPRTYHAKNRTWGDSHVRGRSYHVKNRTWSDNHVRGRTYHAKGRTWGDNHVRGRTYHVKGRTWGDNHVRGRTYHAKGRTWRGDGEPNHVKGRTFHVKGRTWQGGTAHTKAKSRTDQGGTDKPNHMKGRTFHVKGRTWQGGTVHIKAKSRTDQGGTDKPNHVKGRTFHMKGRTWQGGTAHTKAKSRADQGGKTVHTKAKSRADQGGATVPPKAKSGVRQQGGSNATPAKRHRKNRSLHQTGTSQLVSG